LRTCRTVAELRVVLAGAPRPVGFVPTMGALHDGHGANFVPCREQNATAVASIFVNPLQFDDRDDLARYPRSPEADRARLEEAGFDVLFMPDAGQLYPEGFATTVHVTGVTERFEGAARPGHFDGVATVVLKLLQIVRPDRAYFGRKDAQQLAVVRRLVRDLDCEVEIVPVETVRDADGLALSSRNALLDAGERATALGLPRGLARAAEAWRAGERDPDRLVASARDGALDYDYLACVDPDTFGPPAAGGPMLLVAAVRVGSVRLIDNRMLNE